MGLPLSASTLVGVPRRRRITDVAHSGFWGADRRDQLAVVPRASHQLVLAVPVEVPASQRQRHQRADQGSRAGRSRYTCGSGAGDCWLGSTSRSRAYAAHKFTVASLSRRSRSGTLQASCALAARVAFEENPKVENLLQVLAAQLSHPGRAPRSGRVSTYRPERAKYLPHRRPGQPQSVCQFRLGRLCAEGTRRRGCRCAAWRTRGRPRAVRGRVNMGPSPDHRRQELACPAAGGAPLRAANAQVRPRGSVDWRSYSRLLRSLGSIVLAIF